MPSVRKNVEQHEISHVARRIKYKTILENSLAVSNKIEHVNIPRTSNSTPKNIPQNYQSICSQNHLQTLY